MSKCKECQATNRGLRRTIKLLKDTLKVADNQVVWPKRLSDRLEKFRKQIYG